MDSQRIARLGHLLMKAVHHHGSKVGLAEELGGEKRDLAPITALFCLDLRLRSL